MVVERVTMDLILPLLLREGPYESGLYFGRLLPRGRTD